MDVQVSNPIVTETIVSIPPSAASAMASASNEQDEEEDVLRDVLNELDRERSKRAEVESQVRKLQEELERAKKAALPPPETEAQITQRAFKAMEAQVQGYQELVHAITKGKPAIAAAAAQERMPLSDKRKRNTLPLHVVRILEVMPWDARAAEHIFAMEQVFEWQVFDSRENHWQSNIRFFPASFRGLPVFNNDVKMEEKEESDRSLLVYLAGAGGGDKLSSPSKHGVLTNEQITHLYKIEEGFPLPQNGGQWEWIGGWRVDSRIKGLKDTSSFACDDNGWCYAVDAPSFLTASSNSSSNVGPSRENGASMRNIRRRKWSRRRVLVDFPMASERTQQYLAKVAENARLTVTAAKLSEQLVQTKISLTETEANLFQANDALKKQEHVFRAAGVSTDVAGMINTDKSDDSVSSLQDFLTNNDQVREFGSKITQWVKSARKTSEDLTSGESGEEHVLKEASEDNTPQKFPWKKLGRGGLIEKLARPSPGPSRPATSGKSDSSTVSGTGSTGMVEEVSFEPVNKQA